MHLMQTDMEGFPGAESPPILPHIPSLTRVSNGRPEGVKASDVHSHHNDLECAHMHSFKWSRQVKKLKITVEFIGSEEYHLISENQKFR